LLLLFTLFQFGLAWRYLSRLDDPGNYRVIVFFSMLKRPLAAVFCWQFYSLERGLKRLVAGGPLDPLLTAQKNFWVTMAMVIGAYVAALFIGVGYFGTQMVDADAG
jgi:hypothetical protein